jgi:hypothetical protein
MVDPDRAAPGIKLGRTDTTNYLSHNGKGSWRGKVGRCGREEGYLYFGEDRVFALSAKFGFWVLGVMVWRSRGDSD